MLRMINIKVFCTRMSKNGDGHPCETCGKQNKTKKHVKKCALVSSLLSRGVDNASNASNATMEQYQAIIAKHPTRADGLPVPDFEAYKRFKYIISNMFNNPDFQSDLRKDLMKTVGLPDLVSDIMKAAKTHYTS